MAELQSLPLFHRIDGQKVLVLGEGVAAEPKRRLVERAGGIVIDEQAQAVDEGVRIAFVAFDDPKACEVAAINLRCAGMLVNVVDRPELCDFTTPSILDRNPLLIAVGTGGASAGLAKHVRLRLERFLPATIGKLAQALFAVRPKLRQRIPESGERRRAIDEALRQGGTLDPIDPESHLRVEHWAEGNEIEELAGWRVIHVSSDDPDDLTVGQSRLLGEADAVCIRGTIAPAILGRARADAERIHCDRTSCSGDPASAEADPAKYPKCVDHGSASPSRLTVILQGIE
ncbi:MAG: siroheme synthase [Erythrobacter sp.]|nr:siroheme synthase [Erythrobacter sp.]